MSIIRFAYDNLWDDGTVTANSEETDYEATNTQHRWPTRTYRTTDDADEWLKCDLGSAQNIKCIIIENHNFTGAATIHIQGHASDAWADPTVDVTLTVTSSRIVYWWADNQSYRWWRITMVDDANPDEYIEVGRVFLGTYFAPVQQYSRRVRANIDPSKVAHSTGGQISANKITKYKTVSYEFRRLTSANVTSMETIFDAVGMTDDYFICENAAATGNGYLVTFHVRNITPWEFEPIFVSSTDEHATITVETLR